MFAYFSMPGLVELIMLPIIIIAVILAVMGTIKKYAKRSAPTPRQCPHCGGFVPIIAEKCEHCGKELRQAGTDDSASGA